MKPTLLYIHGLSSSGASGTAGRLRLLLPQVRIVSPDLPLRPEAALSLLARIAGEEQPAVVIGTSMGGMLAQFVRGRRKILVNPAFHVSRFMRDRLGPQPFLNPRQDGAEEYEITAALCDEFAAVETRQFEALDDFDRQNTYALFGNRDNLVDGRAEFVTHYDAHHAQSFEGGHRLDEQAMKTAVLPLIRRLLAESGEE